ncbi:MAG: hypothetical protein CM15mV51_0440 [uncultured marine virus]|nr:MAG: hypothetical protein CM15mV51_0440 [uncultured marine virus]
MLHLEVHIIFLLTLQQHHLLYHSVQRSIQAISGPCHITQLDEIDEQGDVFPLTGII